MPSVLDLRRPRNPRSNVSLTSVARGTMQAGTLYPVNFTDVVAGDVMTIDPSVLITTLPLKAPLMGSMDICVEMFFVSDRLYTPALKQNNCVMDNPVNVEFPSFPLSQLKAPPYDPTRGFPINEVVSRLNSPDMFATFCEPNSIADFMGVPVGFWNATQDNNLPSINLNRMLGYADIVRNYYANLQLDYIPLAFTGRTRGNPEMNNFKISDLDALVQDPLAFIQKDLNLFARYLFNSKRFLFLRSQKPTLLESWLNKSYYDSGAGSVSVSVENNEVILTDVRFGSHVLAYMERSLAGPRYDDWLGAQFDVKAQKNMLVPQFLGSFKHVFTIDDIFQTSETTPESPLGALAGRGQSGQKFHRRTFRFEENGTFVCILSSRPSPDYFSGFDPMLFKTTVRDKYAPALDRIGMQALPLAWVDGLPTWDSTDGSDSTTTAYVWDDTGHEDYPLPNPFHNSLGYQPAWSEYRTGFSRLHGSLTGSMRYWTWARRYGNYVTGVQDPAAGIAYPYVYENIINTFFAEAVHDTYVYPWFYNECFADTSPSAENFIYQVKFDIKCNREISKLNMPSFFV